MAHEPRGLVRHAQGAANLVSRDALLAGSHEVGRQKPLVERNLGTLEHRPDRRRELLAASVALIQARAGALALQFRGFVHDAAMRADRTMRPTGSLKMGAGFVGVGEDRISQVHSGSPVRKTYEIKPALSSI